MNNETTLINLLTILSLSFTLRETKVLGLTVKSVDSDKIEKKTIY